MIRIAEIERSIMGELPFPGRPCVIVRLAGCRLRCAWCDTPRALDPHAPGTREMSVDAVVERALTLGPSAILLTGGEPLDQPEAPDLVARLLGEGCLVVIETGGASDIAATAALRGEGGGGLVHVVDVKCPGSGEAGSFREENLARLDGRDRLKFVVVDRSDYRWCIGFLGEHGLRGVPGGGEGDRGSEAGAPGILLSPVHGRLSPSELARWMLEDRLEADLNVQVHRLIGMP
jgi:7-carboxy-7-deazaguanine synthase